MSAGDVVCTGWLVKSPPERKLKRYAWRKRWFVLRHGRMSGNPDVLEYYRSDHSKKPIRVIDLSEGEVRKYAGPDFIRREFQNDFVFVVKTVYRTFYLVAKTEEEMHVWVHNISQICNFGQGTNSTDSAESLSLITSSPQPSPAGSFRGAHVANSSLNADDSTTAAFPGKEARADSEALSLPDYLVLAHCETRKLNSSRCDAWSNSDRSLEQTSSDEVFIDPLQAQAANHTLPSLCSGNGLQDGLSPGGHAALVGCSNFGGPSSDCSSPLPLLGSPSAPSFQVAKGPAMFSCAITRENIPNTPPPRPPKPIHFMEQRSSEERPPLWDGHSSSCGGSGSGSSGGGRRTQWAGVPRRISLSSLDAVRSGRADREGSSLRCHRDKRLSLNLPCRFTLPPFSLPGSSEDSYVPMHPSISSAGSGPESNADGYIAMNSPESLSNPLAELPKDLEPPPVNRDLKPRRRTRPPPLDLGSLSTIREHSALTRTWTVPYNQTSFLSPERDGMNSARAFANSVSGEEEESYIQMEHGQGHSSPCENAFSWPKKFNLDYLALDFNPASPSPVLKKPLISEEHRVDYVQVDEQKTQALQNTKQEWTDERQAKV
ncbi:GRB2-associated-binding protein 3 isoform X2 [Monodelphis domestica]|uniref:GRB2-associated-binding protein 3 isoform X2 n=1 Tax=Monodelphis domestica TaxID=13616 RepID=UPI0024E1D56E|nr:GRB2-associated-binding protein 3 isoform X2 [Monodelphis domestica]